MDKYENTQLHAPQRRPPAASTPPRRLSTPAQRQPHAVPRCSNAAATQHPCCPAPVQQRRSHIARTSVHASLCITHDARTPPHRPYANLRISNAVATPRLPMYTQLQPQDDQGSASSGAPRGFSADIWGSGRRYFVVRSMVVWGFGPGGAKGGGMAWRAGCGGGQNRPSWGGGGGLKGWPGWWAGGLVGRLVGIYSSKQRLCAV